MVKLDKLSNNNYLYYWLTIKNHLLLVCPSDIYTGLTMKCFLKEIS